MPRKPIPETTQQAIKRDYKKGLGTHAELARKYSISVSSVEKICKGIKKGSYQPAIDFVTDGVSRGQRVTVGDIDLTEYLETGIKTLSDDIKTTEAKSKEGIASAALKYMQFYAELNPPTLEDFVDQLLARPDFDPERFVAILKERYAAKAS